MCLLATKKVSHSKNATLVHVFSQKKSSTNADYISLMVFSAIALSSSEMSYLA